MNFLRKTPLFGSLLLLGMFLGSIMYTPTKPAMAEEATVYGVLFFSPACGHCHKVMVEDLPPLMDHYVDQFVLMAIDVSTQEGNVLFTQAIERFQVTPDRQGVPMLIIGDTVLVGSYEIPTQLPGLIDAGLAAGGIPWPEVPGLDVSEQVTDTEPDQRNFWQMFNQDLYANILAVAVLGGMILSVIWIGFATIQSTPKASGSWPGWIFPVLTVTGFAIAGYLSYIEITQTEAICGPIGDCNTVQSSPYARVFGIVPVGVLGLVGYLAILCIWLLQTSGTNDFKKTTSVLIWVLAAAGTLFSIYLTYLEPFVIGATCMWCITSSVIMTILLWASSGPALKQLRVNPRSRKPYQTISRKKV